MRRPSTTTADTATARLQTGPRLLDAGASVCLLPLPFRLAIRAVLWLISDSLPLWPARVDGVGETEEFSPRLVLLRGRKESLCSIERPRYYTTHSAEADAARASAPSTITAPSSQCFFIPITAPSPSGRRSVGRGVIPLFAG